MTTEAPSAMTSRELSQGEAGQDVLVITDADSYGRHGLALPFRNATVIEADAGEKVGIEGCFDAVVIDRSSYDPRWFDANTESVVAALRLGGHVIVTLQPWGEAATQPTTEPPAFAGLAWQGLTILSGLPCAILRPGEPSAVGSVAAGVLFTTAEAAVRLATVGAAGGHTLPGSERANAANAEHLEDRRRSEHALLGHLETLARELDEERRRHQGVALVRTVLRRSRMGRASLRILRPWWRLARRLRAGVAGRLRT